MRDWNNNVRHLIGERSYGKWFGLAQVGQQYRNRPMRDWNNYVRHLIGERFYCEWFGLADVRQQEEQAIEGLEQQCTTFNC